MNKSFFWLALLLLAMPLYTRADSYEGPFCFENPKDFQVSSDGSTDDPSHVRGTCKAIEKDLIVSLDSGLMPDYFLGTHQTVGAGCDFTGCAYGATYSEDDFLTSSSSLTNVHGAVDFWDSGDSDIPSYTLFEKSFFIPILAKAFKSAGLSFSPDSMPMINIRVFKPSELPEVQKYNGDDSSNYALNVLLPRDNNRLSPTYNTTDYQTYGKHIFAPKGTVVESQYIDMKGSPALSDTDLQISSVPVYKGSYAFVVPVTSPLASVKDYWVFIKENGKLVLKWDKSEYGLDNGKVRTITSADKNVTAALLFGDTFGRQDTATSSVNASSTVAQTPGANTGFFSRVIGIILSWFRWL
ncbi:hypothetical protein KGQ72_00610 [Patescibacteria group bacterium]|nr:hypothetical protein [Patescibacteria group bacterium]